MKLNIQPAFERTDRGQAFLMVSDRDISSEVSFSFWQNYDCRKEASVIP